MTRYREMEWLLVVALLLLVITTAYVLHMQDIDYGLKMERFVNYIDRQNNLEVGDMPDLADIQQGLPLSDMLETATGVTALGASECAAADSTRQMELGGQYVQRTNNYRRDYPDHCSSLLSEFVGGFYKPKAGGVGAVVPCDGDC